VSDLLGEDPLIRWVPSHLGRVAERDVLDIEQYLVGALAVPHLVSGVARVGENRADAPAATLADPGRGRELPEVLRSQCRSSAWLTGRPLI
jgi:hypothetical protein